MIIVATTEEDVFEGLAHGNVYKNCSEAVSQHESWFMEDTTCFLFCVPQNSTVGIQSDAVYGEMRLNWTKSAVLGNEMKSGNQHVILSHITSFFWTYCTRLLLCLVWSHPALEISGLRKPVMLVSKTLTSRKTFFLTVSVV